MRGSVGAEWLWSARLSAAPVVPIAFPRAWVVKRAAWTTARACRALGQGQVRWFRTKKHVFAVGAAGFGARVDGAVVDMQIDDCEGRETDDGFHGVPPERAVLLHWREHPPRRVRQEP